MRLEGKVAVVTGASSGIGTATVEALHAEGMTVVATARRAERLEALAQRLRNVHAHPADVTDLQAVTDLARRVAEDLGACHVLVNNAGASFAEPFEGLDSLDEVVRSMDLNFLGAVRCTAAFADLLKASAPARVVNVASVAGKVGAGATAYTAAKFALVGFSEAVGVEWHRLGITVSQVNPGFASTEGFPQRDLLANPLTARLVVEPPLIADAIVQVVRRGTRERTVPRWYRPVVVLRHLTPALFWAAAQRRPIRRPGTPTGDGPGRRPGPPSDV